MTIEEMKANGYRRYIGGITKIVYTNWVEVWAKNKVDAKEIMENSTRIISFGDYESGEFPSVSLHWSKNNRPLYKKSKVRRQRIEA